MINPHLRSHIMKTRGHLFTDERPNLFDNQKQLCEQMDVLLQELENKSDGPGVNRAGFGFQGGNKPFFPRGRGGKPAFGGSNRFSSAPPWFMQPAAGRANNKGHCPPDTCISSALPDSCSRHKLDTTDLTRLDQARERVMGKDLGRRILLILMHWK